MTNLNPRERCRPWTRGFSALVFWLFVLGCVWITAATAAPAVAQTTTQMPELRQRAQYTGAQETGVQTASSNPAASKTPAKLPADVSGSYAFDHNNESIDLDLDRRGKLTGFISRLGDEETDSNTPLTYFFDHASVDSDQLQFETKVVHGLWYSFIGTIVRGSGQARDDEGYYILRGTLSVHHPSDEREKSSEETVEQRKVSYKSLAQ